MSDTRFSYATPEDNDNEEGTAYFLVLSGGAFRGSFQFWVLAHLMATYWFNHISGVSIGIANGLFAAMHKLEELHCLWMSVARRQDFLRTRWLYLLCYVTGIVYLLNTLKLTRWVPGIFSMEPYLEHIRKHTRLRDLQHPLSMGIVAAQGGNELYYDIEATTVASTEELVDLVQASGCLAPYMAPPLVHLPTPSKEEEIGVDGGFWNIFPVPSDQIEQARAEGKKVVIHAIGCTPLDRVKRVERSQISGMISITFRLIEIMEAAIYEGDILQLRHAAGPGGEVHLWVPAIEPGDTFDASAAQRDRRLAESKEMVRRGPIIFTGIG